MNTNQRKLIAALSLCAAVVPNLASAVAISGQGTWESTLQGRDLDGNLATFEAYYDTALDITWLADANYAMTSGYDDDGQMASWYIATAWVASLNPYGSGITGWRLPTTVDVGNDGWCSQPLGTDCGYNVTTHSEMSYMFYVTLGDKAYCSASGVCPQAGWGLTNTGPFFNLQPGAYWSSSTGVDSSFAWYFFFYDGNQNIEFKTYFEPSTLLPGLFTRAMSARQRFRCPQPRGCSVAVCWG